MSQKSTNCYTQQMKKNSLMLQVSSLSLEEASLFDFIDPKRFRKIVKPAAETVISQVFHLKKFKLLEFQRGKADDSAYRFFEFIQRSYHKYQLAHGFSLSTSARQLTPLDTIKLPEFQENDED